MKENLPIYLCAMFRILSGAQEQHGAEDGNDHDKGHFVGDLQHGGNRHCAECHMGQTVADEGKSFQHMPSSGMMIQSHC